MKKNKTGNKKKLIMMAKIVIAKIKKIKILGWNHEG